MDWIERLNQAVGYIDRNLDGEISYEEISRITVAPAALFQRFFVLAAGITLTEYIRRRKLTRALNDLQKTEGRIIDIALKYGYESSDAFCVAFKRLYGITPSQARKTDRRLKHYDRIYFTLTITYVRGERDMVLLNIDKYRYYGPLFEGARIILSQMGEDFSPEYIQGISGAAFKIAGGCPSRPTCVCDRWPTDFLKYLGYEVKEYPCFSADGADISEDMIKAVREQIDAGRPALVWHAFTSEEWDVVCGYDEETKQFIGRGTLRGNDDYAREPWDRAKTSNVWAFGAIVIGERTTPLDKRQMEIESLRSAVRHGRKKVEQTGEEIPFHLYEGIESYNKWADIYSSEGADRGVADAYCYDAYSSVRRAGVIYLREISHHYGGDILESLQKAAGCFEREAGLLADARPYLSWESPWGVDEERSKKLAPILREAAQSYERGIEYIEKALENFKD